MSLLSRNQRAFICADTKIHPLIVDRACEAFDALIERGDVDEYNRLMANAWSQMGYGPGNPIRQRDRPTALDVTKTLLVRAYADREHIGYVRAAARLRQMLEG